MKVLSLLQPWASLVVIGSKKIETRNWRSAYRGELLIHASGGKKGGILTTEPPFKKYILNFDSLPFSAIIGKVILDDIVPIEQLYLSDAHLNTLTLEEKAFGDYARGRYAWLLSDPVEFRQPIFTKGTLRLWEYSGELEE
ncbi:MAG: hypothetical protein JWR72_3095 [Flavisolibacter sp.]|jgi:hypothetical protein|nr:hypothetical protein [Flavisolibacter sp.]